MITLIANDTLTIGTTGLTVMASIRGTSND